MVIYLITVLISLILPTHMSEYTSTESKILGSTRNELALNSFIFYFNKYFLILKKPSLFKHVYDFNATHMA